MKGRKAFTLIELLVVISILVLLMALLFPALSRARKQARAVVCQNRQRGWSVMFAAYQSENEGRFPDGRYFAPDAQAGRPDHVAFPWPFQMEHYTRSDLRDAMVCPMAVKPVPQRDWRTRGMYVVAGTTFRAWRLDMRLMDDTDVARPPYSEYIGSYATNGYISWSSGIGAVKPSRLPAQS